MFGRLAPQLADDGWQPIPVRPRQKVPAVRGWEKPPSPSELQRWVERYPHHGVGLVCGSVVGIDIDITDSDAAGRLHNLAVAHFGETPLVRVGRAPKLMLIYRAREPIPTRRLNLSKGRIELLGEGAQLVAYGIHPDTGRPYSWVGDSDPEFTPPSALQVVTPPQLESFLAEALRSCPR